MCAIDENANEDEERSGEEEEEEDGTGGDVQEKQEPHTKDVGNYKPWHRHAYKPYQLFNCT